MKIALFIALLFISFGSALFADAQAPVYEAMVKIPRVSADSQSTGEYVQALYFLAITVAALLAVVKIIFGGVKWMLSDVITDKSSAKNDIKGAILGLAIVLAAVLILNTINKDLTKLEFLENAPSISGQSESSVAGGSSGTTKTACQKDSGSADCCYEKGGKLTETVDELQGIIIGCSE